MENKQKYVMNKKGATGLSPFVMGIIVTIFFAFCIIGFAINFIGSKNPTSPILSSMYGLNQSYNNLTSSFDSFSGENGTVSSMRAQLGEAQAEPIKYVFLMFQAAFLIPKAMIDLVVSGTTLLSNILYNSLVPNSGTIGMIFVTGISLLMAGLLFTAIFLIVKAIRTGESER